MLQRAKPADGCMKDQAVSGAGIEPRLREILEQCRGRALLRAEGLLGTGAAAVAVGVAVRQALEADVLPEEAVQARQRLSWLVLRAGMEPAPGERAWAVAVADDVGTLPEELQRPWWALLDANDHAVRGRAALRKTAQRLLADLPAGEFEQRFDAWTRLLAAAVSPDLRYGGVTLLNWLLRLAAEQPEARLDESLYRVAQSHWQPAAPPIKPEDDVRNWLEAYLRVLETRPAASAVVCWEALSLHPATATLPSVWRLAETLRCGDR